MADILDTYVDTKALSTPGDFEKAGFTIPGVTSLEAAVDEDYVPEGYETVGDYLQCARDDYEADLEADRENREAALEDKEFAAGEQWDPAVLASRKGLPSFVINTVPQFLAQVVGDWRSNKTGIKIVATEDGDSNAATVREDIVRAIEQKSRSERVYNDAFESALTCGDGAFRVTTEYLRDDVFDQEIALKPITDALSCVWDRLSVDPTGRDARRVFVDDVLPRKEFDKKWPEHSSSTLGVTTMSTLRSAGWIDDTTVKVTEHWRMIERPRLLAMFEDGTVLTLDKENIEDLLSTKGNPIRTRVAPCSYAQMHLISGHAILAGPFELKLTRLPIIRMTGRVQDIAGRRVRYGLTRFMKDSVRLRNFWRSVAAEQLGQAPKAQWIGTESAFEGYEDQFRAAHTTRDPILKVSDEAVIGQNLQRVEPPTPQMALHQEAVVNSQDLKDVTGIHDASLGVKSNEVSGKAITARQNQGGLASLTYYDNGNAAIQEAGDVINQLIPQIYDGMRITRGVGEDGTARFVKLNDPYDPEAIDLSVGTFDVVSSTGASYTTRRVEAADAMLQAVQVWPQLMEIAGDLVVKAQDWPGAEKFAERLKKAIPAQLTAEEGEEQVDPQVQQLTQALEMAGKEIEKLQEERLLDVEKLKIDWYKAVTDRLEALSDDTVDAAPANMSAMAEMLSELMKQPIPADGIAPAELSAELLGAESPEMGQIGPEALSPAVGPGFPPAAGAF